MRAFTFTFILSFLLPAAAHEGPTDGFGCHGSKSGTYHCHSGPLAGRAFVNKSAAVNAMMALTNVSDDKPEAVSEAEHQTDSENGTGTETATETAAERKPALTFRDEDPLKVISWHSSRLGKDNMDYRQIAYLIAIADLVILEGLSTTDLGRHGLKELSAALSKAVDEKICRALLVPPKGAKSRMAILWKDRKLAFVSSNGSFRETCADEYPIKHDRGIATLYVRQAKLFVNVAGVSKESDVNSVLAGLAAAGHWPAIAAGAFEKQVPDSRFSPVISDKRPDLKSAQRGFKKASDNFWVSGLGFEDARVVDLHAEYPDIDVDQIRARFSDHCPIYSEFRFAIDDENPDTTTKRIPTGDASEATTTP